MTVKRPKKGLFITFEGIEGSGKTTQIKALADWLTSQGRRVLQTREPGGTPLADRIRKELLDAGNKGMSPRTELFLYEVARRDHVSEVILPALSRGDIVLCDRFTDATLAYQGFGRKIRMRLIEFFNRAATGGLTPDLTLLIDLPVKDGLERAKKRSGSLDRLEQEARIFHERIRRGYLTLARKGRRRFVILDGRKPREQIFELILRAVESRLRRR